jgi:endonuclease/exonuclease/phosphatase family metal-dependent hydrolase
VLVRTWNLFHGNTVPPERRAHLREMIELATSDRPDILLLQEIPAWALPRVAGWARMRAGAVDVAARPPLGAWLGLWITRVNSGLIRSAVAGQGNALLVAPYLEPAEADRTVLNPVAYRRQVGDRLALTGRSRTRWAGERRICQSTRVTLPSGRSLLLANLHISNHLDVRIRDAELERAFSFVGRDTGPAVLGGDFNRSPRTSPKLRALIDDYDFSWSDSDGIDHILVRGATASPPLRWPDERRQRDGRLLSDHAPVEVQLDVR